MLNVAQLVKLANANGLKLGSAVALVFIGDNPGMTSGDLSVDKGTTTAACTAVVDTLCARKLIRRCKSPLDRRLVLLKPTALGIEELKKAAS